MKYKCRIEHEYDMTYGCINSIKISVAAPSDKEKKGGK